MTASMAQEAWAPTRGASSSALDHPYWVKVGRLLATRPGPRAERTSPEPVYSWRARALRLGQDWVRDQGLTGEFGGFATFGAAVVASGVAVEDLYALAPLLAPDTRLPDDTGWALMDSVATGSWGAEMPLCDLVGWLLAELHVGTGDEAVAARRWRAWGEAGFGADAWVFAAAGFTVAEAAAGLASGALDVAGAKVLVALSGAVTPVG